MWVLALLVETMTMYKFEQMGTKVNKTIAKPSRKAVP